MGDRRAQNKHLASIEGLFSMRYLTPLLLSFFLVGHVDARTIYIVGDSTASIKAPEDRPETGWGEAFADQLSGTTKLQNFARNGRSTRSFVAEGRWQTVVDQLNQDDIVLIQFGHNDQKLYDYKRFADPWRDYPLYLRTFINDVRKKGAYPVLLTPIERRKFDTDGSVSQTHRPYPQVMRDLARTLNVPLIDANAFSRDWLTKLGKQASKGYFLHLPAGVNPNYADGIADDTHLNEKGAKVIAEFVAQELEQLPIPYSDF